MIVNAGTVTLNGATSNGFTGTTTVTSGTLNLNKGSGVVALVGDLTINAAAQVNDSGTQINNSSSIVTDDGMFTLGPGSDTIGALAGAASGVVQLTGALTVGDAANSTFNGIFTGAGALTKVGSGTLTLTGNSGAGFTGLTTVNAGTLTINGNNAGSPVSVRAGTLAGTGTVEGFDLSGGSVSPTGTGTLATAGGAFANTLSGATFVDNLSGPASTSLLATGNGATIDLTGSTLTVVGAAGSAIGDTYVIVNRFTSGIHGTFTGLANGATLSVGGRTFEIACSPTQVTLAGVQQTTTSVVSSAGPSDLGQPVTFTATVSPAASGPTPTGSVSFPLDGTPLGGPIALVNGVATSLPTFTAQMAAGSHAVVATYLPTGPSLPSTATLTQAVNVQATSTTLFTSLNPVQDSQPVTFTAVVSDTAAAGFTPTGAVAFSVDGAPPAIVSLVNGVATLTTPLADGPHIIGAAYSSDGNFLASGGTLSETVNSTPSQTEGSTPSQTMNAAPSQSGTSLSGVIAVGSGAGTAAEVKVCGAATQTLKADLIPFGSFTGGVRVAVGDVNGDGTPDIIVGAGPGGGPEVIVYDGAGISGGVPPQSLYAFYALPSQFTGGVRVGYSSDFQGHPSILSVAGSGGGPQTTVFDGLTRTELDSFYTFAPTFTGGVFVGGS